jgi:hypothetical protein
MFVQLIYFLHEILRLKAHFLVLKTFKTDDINQILIIIDELFYSYFCQCGRDFAKLITLTE